MLVAESTAAINAACLNADHVRPLYDTFGFARIPDTIGYLLTGKAASPLPGVALDGLPDHPATVVMVMLDSFGWHFFSRYLERAPFLHRFLHHGRICLLTTAFPSSTPVHVTLLHTGLAADQSGIYEWHVFDPDLQAVIGSLLFSPVFDRKADGLVAYGVDPLAVYPQSRFYQQLQTAGVSSVVLMPAALAHSVYTRTMCSGALVVPFQDIPDATVRLRYLFEHQVATTFYHLYIDSVDAAMHRYGPESVQVENEIVTTLDHLEQYLWPLLHMAPQPTVLLLTADHGQITVDPQQAIVLNRLWPDLERFLRQGGDRRPLPPSGSPRVTVLHVQPAAVADVQLALQRRLGERATVVASARLVEDGYFGPQPGERLHSRLGELIILPAPGEVIVWDHPQAKPFTYRGMHGGLTPTEMLTELAWVVV